MALTSCTEISQETSFFCLLCIAAGTLQIACYACSAGCRGFATDTKGLLDGAKQMQQLATSGK
jgi:hypothetical protein